MFGKVKLVAVTKPVDDSMSADDFIAYVARVSNPSNQHNKSTSGKLIKYLRDNNHWSPFEMAHVVMEITTTRDIARQILRHRSFSFQEFSQRYADPTADLGFVTREARLQDKKNRQNSFKNEDKDLEYEWIDVQRELIYNIGEYYNWAISSGIAKEQARALLPEGLTVSRMYMSGSLRSWIHYCGLRMDNGTQMEHKLIATMCWDQIRDTFSSLERED